MTDLKKKSVEDLNKALLEKREDIRSTRFDLAGTIKKNTKATRNNRKTVARILTEINTRKANKI